MGIIYFIYSRNSIRGRKACFYFQKFISLRWTDWAESPQIWGLKAWKCNLNLFKYAISGKILYTKEIRILDLTGMDQRTRDYVEHLINDKPKLNIMIEPKELTIENNSLEKMKEKQVGIPWGWVITNRWAVFLHGLLKGPGRCFSGPTLTCHSHTTISNLPYPKKTTTRYFPRA